MARLGTFDEIVQASIRPQERDLVVHREDTAKGQIRGFSGREFPE